MELGKTQRVQNVDATDFGRDMVLLQPNYGRNSANRLYFGNDGERCDIRKFALAFAISLNTI